MTVTLQLASPHSSLTARLRDGTVLRIRPLKDGERRPLLDVFDHMSPQSRYLRFLSPVPTLTEPMLRQLTTLDHRNRVAWAAYDGTQCIGIVRYVRLADRPDAAELAVSVVDAMHRRGVGRVLFGVLAAVAATHGIATFTLTVHPENRSSLALSRALSARFRMVDGVYEGQVATAAVLADERVRQQVDLAALQNLASAGRAGVPLPVPLPLPRAA